MAKLPTSKATNAYELLDEVKALILAEPKRYNQSTWFARLGHDNVTAIAVPEGFPACGTVCCVAGWIATLKHGESFDPLETPDIAADILGINVDSAMVLSSGASDVVTGAPQTREHAESGVRHIEWFQNVYADHLKATRV